MRVLWLAGSVLFALAASPVAAADAAPAACLSSAEMQAEIAARKVIPPAEALRTARALVPGADIVRARLCRRAETLYYVVTALRRDGRVLPIAVDAVSGKLAADR